MYGNEFIPITLSKRPAHFRRAQIPPLLQEALDHPSDAKRHLEKYGLMSALFYAIECNLFDLFILTLDCGISLDAERNGRTALHYAAWRGNVKMIGELLKRGANPNAVSSLGQTPLQYAIETGKTDHVHELISKGADFNYTKGFFRWEGIKYPSTLLYAAISSFYPDIALALIKSGASTVNLYYMLKKANVDVARFKSLFRYINVSELPYFNYVKDKSFFARTENIIALFRADDPLEFLVKKGLCPETPFLALQLISQQKKVLAMEKRRNSDKANNLESAMEDKDVLAANKHYKDKVKPYFEGQFLSYSNDSDPMECIELIEKDIRKLLLEMLLEMAVEDKKFETEKFINDNKEKLIAGDPSAMQASCPFFEGNSIIEAAWRGYNPFAPTISYPNLLTPQLDEVTIFSTAAAHQSGGISNVSASAILRERVAMYFLAVMDQSDGTPEDKKDRIAIFVGKLADIRNSHVKDNPACFPGTITHISGMGARHSVAQLPTESYKYIETWFIKRVLSLFQLKMDELTSHKQRTALYHALVNLTVKTAPLVLEKPDSYKESWIPLRQKFIAEIGDANTILKEIAEQNAIVLEQDDMLYIEQHLMDVAMGAIAQNLSDIYNKKHDSEPTLQDLQEINPFDPNENLIAHRFFNGLLNSISENVPSYTKSLHKLTCVSQMLAVKIPGMLKSMTTLHQDLEHIMDSLDCIEEQRERVVRQFMTQTMPELALQGDTKSELKNPFEKQLETLTKQMKQLAVNTMQQKGASRLKTLEAKYLLFNDVIIVLQKELQEHQPKPEILSDLGQCIVNHIIFNERFIMAAFLEADVKELSHETQLFLMNLNNMRIWTMLAKHYNHQPRPLIFTQPNEPQKPDNKENLGENILPTYSSNPRPGDFC